MENRSLRLETKAIHSGTPRSRVGGAAVLPIFQCSVFEQPEDLKSYEDILYPRMNTLPNHLAVGEKVAALEGAEMGLVTASGMGAIAPSLLEVLQEGGHLLIQNQLYGGTHSFVTERLRLFRIEFDFIDGSKPESWKEKIRPETRTIYTEAITNPLMRVVDHPEVVAFAKEHDLVSMIDNTFATPINFRPHEIGYDIVLHSATKYLNGHSDLVAGVVTGSEEWIVRIRRQIKHLGASLDAHACYLLERGLKTLALRVGQQNANALELARFLDEHPRTTAVHYPGLPSAPDHSIAKEIFSGFGGMLSFEMEGGVKEATAFQNKLEIPVNAPSLGGVESLVTRPAFTSQSALSPQEREETGVSESLLRVSVGIEAIEDLIADFDRALS